MVHRSAGTLALPWSQTSQRSGQQRVAADHTLLAVTMTLALVGLVMVFSASAIVAGNRFQDPGFFLKTADCLARVRLSIDDYFVAHRLRRSGRHSPFRCWAACCFYSSWCSCRRSVYRPRGHDDGCGGDPSRFAGGNGQTRSSHLHSGVFDQKGDKITLFGAGLLPA